MKTLFCCNKSGSENRKILIDGHSGRARCCKYLAIINSKEGIDGTRIFLMIDFDECNYCLASEGINK